MSAVRCFIPILLVFAAASAAFAQQFTPRIGYVYPAGGRQGATTQLTIGGQFLEGVTNAFVSGGGVEAKVVSYVKPLTQQQFNQLRERAQELQKQPKDAATLKELADIRKKLLTFNRNANPAIAETVTLQIAAAPDATPGERELRLSTPLGLSNPRVIRIGQFQEFSKPSAKKTEETGAAQPFRNRNQPQGAVPSSEFTITLPATVNGQIMPGGVDRYRFRARSGQQLVVAVSARELIPYLADAVPGWFQATLALFDAKGKELAYDDDFRFHPDPVLFYKIPSDGEYVAEIKDAIYRGREDFVYRITIGELPFVTSIFPLGGPAGTAATIAVKGWNLPTNSLTLDAKEATPGVHFLCVSKDGKKSNPVPFAVDTLEESFEHEPNNSQASAEKVTLPIVINGRIDEPGDWDVFRFEGRAGDSVVAEVHARRLDSPLDSVLKLTDASGKQLAFNDDHADKGSGLNTHHADSYLAATLPADGAYYLHLGDTQRKGGLDYAYRLRVSAPRPDFALRVAPASVSVRGGASVPLTVYALRKDGFTNEITLALEDAPAGFSLSGARIPANQDQVRITLSAPVMAQKEPASLALEGRATIGGKQIVRPAVPAEDMMQAFAYRHLVPAKELEVAVAGRGMGRTGARIIGTSPVKIPAGGTARVQVGVPANGLLGKIHLELSEPPEGITIKSISPSGFGSEIVLQTDATKVKPGLAGNLIVNAFADRTQGTEKARPNNRRMPVATLPAISYEIVER